MSASPELERKIAALPRGPGVYLFKDAAGKVIYVGKAKSLRDRVRSYFRAGGDGRPAVRFLEALAVDVEVIATRSEKEAFLLENNVIKKTKPRFNIRLKDDKAYLHLRIDGRHPYPAIVPVRRPRKDGATYFGPYSSARGIRTTLRVLRTVYPLRDCTDFELAHRTRPCLKHQLGTCSAPCVGLVSESAYAEYLEGAKAVLRGDTAGLVEALREQMQQASLDMQFERAAVLRDRIAYLSHSTEEQAVETDRRIDRDAIGWFRRGRQVEAVVLQFRGGKLLGAESFSLESEMPDDEAVASFLGQYYHTGRPLPHEVLLPVETYAADVLEELLSERHGRPVRVRRPVSGDGRRAIEMARQNAELSAQTGTEQSQLQDRILEGVREWAGCDARIRSLECIDASHLQGDHAVASLVRFVDGEPEKSGYRRFRLTRTAAGDDVGAMREVIARRFGSRGDPATFPNLLLVDGGRGQVRAAREALDEQGRAGVGVVGIVKPPRRGRGLALGQGEEERLVRVDGAQLPLEPQSEACYLLQRVRDEAHRFALAYHRRLRTRASGRTDLERLEGLGPERARSLLVHFGGLRGLAAASREQLARVPGIGPTLAERVWSALHP